MSMGVLANPCASLISGIKNYYEILNYKYIINGSYYTGGKGDDEYYRESLSPEDYANMNELLNGEGLGFDENGNPINVDPTDFGNGNVNDFNGGGYLK